MKETWKLEPSGLGWNYHIKGDIVIEPEDLDQNLWTISIKGKGTCASTIGWRSARKMAETLTMRQSNEF